MKPLRAGASLATAMLLLAACGAEEDLTQGEQAAADDQCADAVIGDSIPQASDPGLQLIHGGLSREAEALGMEVLVADADLDVGKQLSDVDSFITRGVDGISIWPMDGVALRPAINRAADEGIVVVTQNTMAEVDLTANILFDDIDAGRRAAAYLAQELGNGAQVAAIFGPQEVESFRNLAAGFQEGAEEHGLELVETQENPALSAEVSTTMARQFETRYGDELDGIFDTLNATALGVATTLSDDFSPLIVTYAGDEPTRMAIADGRLAATSYIAEPVAGRARAWAICQSLQGVELPRDIYVPFIIADQGNVDAIPDEEEQRDTPLEFSVEEVGDRHYLSWDGLEFPESAVP